MVVFRAADKNNFQQSATTLTGYLLNKSEIAEALRVTFEMKRWPIDSQTAASDSPSTAVDVNSD